MASRISTAKVFLALVFCQLAFAAYAFLTKASLNTGMDPGLFVLLRDANTAWIHLLVARCVVGEFRLPLPEDRLLFFVLGAFGLYFGQYCTVQGIKYGTPVLATMWSNVIPVATYLLGLLLGTEKIKIEYPYFFRLVGVILAIVGPILVTLASEQQNSKLDEKNMIKASLFFCLQVLLGGAGFWHLQKSLLNKGYQSTQVVAWYYCFGVILLALVVLPTSMNESMWHFSTADLEALGFGLLVWPAAAFLLTFANAHASPVTVMAFAPLQIVAAMGLEFFVGANKGVPPSSQKLAGAVLVVVGLGSFVTGHWMQENIDARSRHMRAAAQDGACTHLDEPLLVAA